MFTSITLTSNYGKNSYILDFFYLTCSWRNVFLIFLNFWNGIKKSWVDIHLRYFCQKSSRSPTLSTSPLLLLKTTWGHEKTLWLWSAVQRGASQNSNQFLVPGRVEFRGCPVLSWARSLALSKWTAGAALFWANSWNRSALLHTC